MANHELIANPDTVHWGFYEAALSPVLKVASGDTIEVHTEPPGLREIVRPRASRNLLEILERKEMGMGSHIMTGPIAVEGAEPGDVLEVRFHQIEPRYDWGFNAILPLKGGLPEDFPRKRMVIVEINREAMVGDWGAGVKVPLRPFFGNFGVAPSPEMGRIPTTMPGVWGGNIDNKELTAGATVYFPVFNDGALFSVGDGHGCQGDGEANSFGIEMGLTATIELIVRKDMNVEMPRAETETHHILMGFDPIIDNAAKMALRETIAFLGEAKGMSREDAYTLCSLAVDLRVTQIVNGVKGVHAMLAKSLLEQREHP